MKKGAVACSANSALNAGIGMKDMEVGQRLRVSLTEVRMYLVVLENSQSIC